MVYLSLPLTVTDPPEVSGVRSHPPMPSLDPSIPPLEEPNQAALWEVLMRPA